MKNSYAQLADKLSKKLGEYEDILAGKPGSSVEPSEINAAKLKVPQIKQALQQLEESQKVEVNVKELTDQGVPKDEARQVVMQQMQEEQMQMQQQQQDMQMQQQQQEQQAPQEGQPQPQQQEMPMDQGMSPYKSGGNLPMYQSSSAILNQPFQQSNLSPTYNPASSGLNLTPATNQEIGAQIASSSGTTSTAETPNNNTPPPNNNMNWGAAIPAVLGAGAALWGASQAGKNKNEPTPEKVNPYAQMWAAQSQARAPSKGPGMDIPTAQSLGFTQSYPSLYAQKGGDLPEYQQSTAYVPRSGEDFSNLVSSRTTANDFHSALVNKFGQRDLNTTSGYSSAEASTLPGYNNYTQAMGYLQDMNPKGDTTSFGTKEGNVPIGNQWIGKQHFNYRGLEHPSITNKMISTKKGGKLPYYQAKNNTIPEYTLEDLRGTEGDPWPEKPGQKHIDWVNYVNTGIGGEKLGQGISKAEAVRKQYLERKIAAYNKMDHGILDTDPNNPQNKIAKAHQLDQGFQAPGWIPSIKEFNMMDSVTRKNYQDAERNLKGDRIGFGSNSFNTPGYTPPKFQASENEIPWKDISQGVLGAVATAPIFHNIKQSQAPIDYYEGFVNPYIGQMENNIGKMEELAAEAETAINTPRYYNPRSELVAANRRRNSAMQNAADASGGSARFALQNRARTQLANDTDRILSKAQNTNAQWNDPARRAQQLAGLGGLYGNIGQMGYGMGQDMGAERWKEFDWAQRAEAARRGFGTQAAMDTSEWAQTQQQIGNQKEMDQLSIDQLSAILDDFEWKDGKWTPKGK